MSITAYQVEAVGHDRSGNDFGYVNIMYRYGNKQPCPPPDQCEKLEIGGRLEYYLPEEGAHDQRAQDYLWREVLWAIWGKDSENGGGKVIKAAPKELRERYQEIFE